MRYDRARSVFVWIFVMMSSAVFLSLKGLHAASMQELTSAAKNIGIAGVVGLGLGLTFAPARNRTEELLRLIYAALPFGFFGAWFGYENAITPEHLDPGASPTIRGMLWGVVVGVAVGAITTIEQRLRGNKPGSQPKRDA